MLPLGKIMRYHQLDYHFYAYDSQLYLVFQPMQESADTAINKMMNCISDNRSWMGVNKLMLNAIPFNAIPATLIRGVFNMYLKGI